MKKLLNFNQQIGYTVILNSYWLLKQVQKEHDKVVKVHFIILLRDIWVFFPFFKIQQNTDEI